MTSILIIYTGGTIGMYENPVTGALENFDFAHLARYVPELPRLGYDISGISFTTPLDSSDIEPQHWVKMAQVISYNYEAFDGFVILHGTDTMAYTASALSFMLEGLAKPVIITGSQLPIGKLRTDGHENLLTSVEIAASRNDDGLPMVPEVCIYFERKLMRGNRTMKINADGFNAFRSYNLPPLAHADVNIVYNTALIRYPLPGTRLRVHGGYSNHIVVITLFPGIRRATVAAMMQLPGLRGVILETYGSGNAPQKEWLSELIAEAQGRGIIVVNITQCHLGSVAMQRYTTGLQLLRMGVVNGYDSTPEAMVTKLMLLLGRDLPEAELRRLLGESIAGEITTD